MVLGVAWAPGDLLFATAARDSTVKLWTMEASGPSVMRLHEAEHAMSSYQACTMSFGPCGPSVHRIPPLQSLTSQSQLTHAQMSAGPAQKPCVVIKLPMAVTSVAFAPVSSTATDGSVTWHLAAGMEDGRVELWRIAETGGEAAGLPSHTASRLWQASQFHAHAGAVRRLAWRQRNVGVQLATCSEDHAVRLFDVAL